LFGLLYDAEAKALHRSLPLVAQDAKYAMKTQRSDLFSGFSSRILSVLCFFAVQIDFMVYAFKPGGFL